MQERKGLPSGVSQRNKASLVKHYEVRVSLPGFAHGPNAGTHGSTTAQAGARGIFRTCLGFLEATGEDSGNGGAWCGGLVSTAED